MIQIFTLLKNAPFVKNIYILYQNKWYPSSYIGPWSVHTEKTAHVKPYTAHRNLIKDAHSFQGDEGKREDNNKNPIGMSSNNISSS